MTVRDWADIERRFLELADLPYDEQRLQLAKLRHEDASVANEIERLLSADASGETLLDRSIATRAADLLAHDDAAASTRFGPYQLDRFIGEGGMGVVHLAHREDLGTTVAIKVLRDAWLSPSRRDRFREEQRTLAALDHPGIARLLDADHLDDGTPWFAMEYVEGAPITEWCWTRSLSLRERLALVVAALDAVRHAHERAIIHRDLKPSNLLVTAAGQVKLLDFGIAKRTGSGSVVDATRTGLRLLTPAYASPEQLAGEPVGVQADVFAIGVVLFELLAGVRPYQFAELGTDEAVRRLRSEPPARLSAAVRRAVGDARARCVGANELSAAAWSDLEALVAGALDANLGRRYRSADALLRDIRRFLASEPLEMRPASLTHRWRLLLRRRRTEVTLATVATLVFTLGAVSYTHGITSARDAATAQVARTERLQEFLVRLFSGGDEVAGPADTLRVAALIDNGVREARLLTEAPDEQLDLFQSLGTIAQQLGRYELADSLLRDAVRGRESLHGPAHEETLQARALLAGLLADRQDYDAARIAFLELRDAAARVLPAGHRIFRIASGGLGVVLSELGESDSALTLLEESVRLHALEDSTSVSFANALTSLANEYAHATKYDVSDSLNLLALGITKQKLGSEHPSLAYNHVNLASNSFERGRLDEAESHFQRALELNERWHGPEHPLTASVLRQFAQLRVYEGRAAEALPMLERVAKAYAIRFDTLSPSLANLYSSMAQVRGALGDTLASVELHMKAREIARAALGTSHPHFRMHTGNLASALTLLGRFDEASALLVPMLEEARSKLAASDINLAFWTVRLGRVRAGQRRWAESDSLYALALEGFRSSGFADTATITHVEGEQTRVRDSMNRRGQVLR